MIVGRDLFDLSKRIIYLICVLIFIWVPLIPGTTGSPQCITTSARPNVQFVATRMLVQYTNVSMLECLQFCCQYDDCEAVTYTGFLQKSAALKCTLYPCAFSHTIRNGPCSLEEVTEPSGPTKGILTAFVQRNNQPEIQRVPGITHHQSQSIIPDDSGTSTEIPVTQPISVITETQTQSSVSSETTEINGEISEITTESLPKTSDNPDWNLWNAQEDESKLESRKSDENSDDWVISEPGAPSNLKKDESSGENSKIPVEETLTIPMTIVIIVGSVFISCILINSILAGVVLARRKNRRRILKRSRRSGGGFEINPVYAHSPATTTVSSVNSATYSGKSSNATGVYPKLHHPANTVTDSIPNYFTPVNVKAYDNFYC